MVTVEVAFLLVIDESIARSSSIANFNTKWEKDLSIRNFMDKSLFSLFLFFLCLDVYGQNNQPIGAKVAGLSNIIFQEEFKDESKIDLENTKKVGFNFYLSRPFGWPTTRADSLSVKNGVLTIKNPINKAQFDIVSATSKNKGEWVGFAHRGSAYFEASIAFDPDDFDKIPKKSGFPAFWTMSAEHLFETLSSKNKRWYEYLEIDFMEWNPEWHSRSAFIQSIHYWVKDRGKNKRVSMPACYDCPMEGKVIDLGGTINFMQFNTFGILWIPGERIDTYVNDVLVRSVRVSDYPAIESGNDHHFPVILGSGKFPMRVDWVRVWGR
ncbi:MAG: hypothetical protein KGZ88_21935 [Methylomicrobium sp.]|nr:hypothetical protein [Methylomicrobium sp.]